MWKTSVGHLRSKEIETLGQGILMQSEYLNLLVVINADTLRVGKSLLISKMLKKSFKAREECSNDDGNTLVGRRRAVRHVQDRKTIESVRRSAGQSHWVGS